MTKKIVLLLVLVIGLSASAYALPMSEITLHEVKGLVYSNFIGEISTWGLDESPGVISSNGWCFSNWYIEILNDPFGPAFTGILNFDEKKFDLAGLDIGKWDFILVENKPNPQTAPVPEPATMILLGSGLLGGLWSRRKIGVKA